MTISNENRAVSYVGNDVATEFPFSFRIPEAEHLFVSVFDSNTSITTDINSGDYSVTGIGDAAGGAVTYPLTGDPLTPTQTISITRTVPYTQDTELGNQGGYYPEVVEEQLDLIVMQIQQLSTDPARSIRSDASETFENDLPLKEELAGNTLAFDDDGEPTVGPAITDLDAIDSRLTSLEDTIDAINDLGGVVPATVSQADAEAGVATVVKSWTALRVRQSELALAASEAEALAGVSSTKFSTPERVKQYVDSVLGVENVIRVRVASTANVTIATGLNNGDTLNGRTLATDDLVLLAFQTAAEENGIYVVGVSPARLSTIDSFDKHCGLFVRSYEGTLYSGVLWLCVTETGGVLDTDALEFKSIATEFLNADRTYYVRTDANDENTGLADSAGSAFLTIQRAIDVASNIDLGNYNITIQIADGTYTGAITLKNVKGKGKIILKGNTGTPSNVVISVTSASAISSDGSARGVYELDGIKIATTTSGNGLFAKGPGLTVRVARVNFGACVNSHIRADLQSLVLLVDNYTISGAAARHFHLNYSSVIQAASAITITVSGTPAFSSAFAFANLIGLLDCENITFSGSATGVRYSATINGSINTNGGGANFFPGNSAGSTANGGVYV